MKALLLVAHGSRLALSNQEVVDLIPQIAEVLTGNFEWFETAFLELAEPDIPTGIKNCVDAGADFITLVPYFLAAGTHVINDIPAIVEQAHQDYPDCSFQITDHVGASSMMPALVQEMVKRV